MFNNRSKFSRYVVVGMVLISFIIMLAMLLVTLSLSNSTNNDFNQIEDTTNITTETTTITSSNVSETTTTFNNETTTTEKIKETTTVSIDSVTTDNTLSETTVTQSVPTVVNSPVETFSEVSSDTENTTVTSQTTAVITSAVQTEVKLKSNEEIANEVINGLWGNGDDRKNRLINAGYNYNDVQRIVDKLMMNSTTVDSNPVSNENEIQPIADVNTTFVKTFTRGTYYAYGGPRNGGSGRQLIDCSIGEGNVKGSIASSYLYRNYGYNYNGKRTMVYLEINGYPYMTGMYYLDDSDAGNPEVIDFFYLRNSNCQFQYQGVVTVNCYIVSY